MLLPEAGPEVTVGAAVETKSGSSASGDSWQMMRLAPGKTAVVLSDGMGSGEEAKRQSQTTVKLLEQLLLGGADHQLALETARQHAGCELRTHFHVPLFYAGDGVLNSTHSDLTPAFFAHADAQSCPLEIETYTFNVLPPALRPAGVVDSLVQEAEWVRAARAQHP